MERVDTKIEPIIETGLKEWSDLPSLIQEKIIDALVPTIDDNGCYDPEEIYEAIRCITNDPNLKNLIE